MRGYIFTGIVRGAGKIDGFFYLLTTVLVNYTIWQFRLKKNVPSIASILEDVDNLFDMCVLYLYLTNIRNSN